MQTEGIVLLPLGMNKETKEFLTRMKNDMNRIFNDKFAKLKSDVEHRLAAMETKVNSQKLSIKEKCREFLVDKMQIVNEIEKATQYNSDETDELKVKVANCIEMEEQLINSMRSANESMQRMTSAIAQKKNDIVNLQAEFESIKQYSCRDNLVIPDIPYSKGEDTTEKVLQLFEGMQLGIGRVDISTSHRLHSKYKRNQDIIVRFSNRDARNWVYKHRKVEDYLNTYSLPYKVNPKRLYINEHLTKYNKKIMYEARQLKRHEVISDVWSYNCKIFVKKHDNSHAIYIKSISDLDVFYNNNNV